MATWSVILDFSGTQQDITNLVDVRSIKKETTLFNELKPTSNRIDFKTIFDSTLYGRLVTSKEASIVILRNGTAWFTGVLSPNYQAQIIDGRKMVSMIAEDYSLSKLGKTISTLIAYSSYRVCSPASTATSIVHALATAAGVTLAASPPTISALIPIFVVLTDEKATYGSLLAQILFDYGYTYYFNADGSMALIQLVNPGTITTGYTLTTQSGSSNIRQSIDIDKKPEKYDDIRIRFDALELKTGIVLFQDNSGATASIEAVIPLAANGDAGKGDYYPKGSDAGEIFSEWKSPEGYKIFSATSATLDSVLEGGISLNRSLTNYYKRASFGYHNTAGSVKNINKLKINGDAYVIVSSSVARYAETGAKLLLEYQAKYIKIYADAQALARNLAQYYKYSDIMIGLKSKVDIPIGSYVLIQDPSYSGISISARLIKRTDDENSASMTYLFEAVADYQTVTTVSEGTSPPPVQTSPGTDSLSLAATRIESSASTVFQKSDGTFSPSSITFSGKKFDGTLYSGWWKVYRGPVGVATNCIYTSASAESSINTTSLQVASDTQVASATLPGGIGDIHAELYSADDFASTHKLDTYNVGTQNDTEGFSLSYSTAASNLAIIQSAAYADGIVSTEEARAIADAQAKADAALVQANAAVAGLAPKYLGKLEDAAPIAHAVGDTYTRYSQTPGTTNRGVFKWDSGVWTRTEARADIMAASADIAIIISKKDPGSPLVDLYGDATGYTSDSTIQADYAFFQAAFIGFLEANEVTVRNLLKTSDGYAFVSDTGDTDTGIKGIGVGSVAVNKSAPANGVYAMLTNLYNFLGSRMPGFIIKQKTAGSWLDLLALYSILGSTVLQNAYFGLNLLFGTILKPDKVVLSKASANGYTGLVATFETDIISALNEYQYPNLSAPTERSFGPGAGYDALKVFMIPASIKSAVVSFQTKMTGINSVSVKVFNADNPDVTGNYVLLYDTGNFTNTSYFTVYQILSNLPYQYIIIRGVGNVVSTVFIKDALFSTIKVATVVIKD